MRYFYCFIGLITFLSCLADHSFGQSPLLGNSAADQALSGANLTDGSLAVDGINPASLRIGKGISAMIAFMPSARGLTEASIGSGAVIFPFDSSNALGIVGTRYGYQTIYSETMIGLGFAHDFRIAEGQTLEVGIRSRYDNQHYGGGYGQISGVHIDAGANLSLSSQVSCGLSTGGIVTFGDEWITRVPRFDFGVTYRPSTDLRIHVAPEYDEEREFLVRGGIEYDFAPTLTMVLGYESLTGSPSGGIQLFIAPFVLGIAAVDNPEFGYSVTFEVGYQ